MTEITQLHEPYFTHKEVIELAGVPDRTLLVWQQRNVFQFFEDSFTPNRGRRLYSPIDVFQVAILYSLTQSTQVKPSTYSSVIRTALSDSANQLFHGYWRFLRCTEEELEYKLNERYSDPLLLVLYARGGCPYGTTVKKSVFNQAYSSKSKQKPSWMDYGYITLPFDKLITDLREKMKAKFDVEVE